MVALALGFLCGIVFTITFAVLVASGMVRHVVESFTLLDDEVAVVDDFAHLR